MYSPLYIQNVHSACHSLPHLDEQRYPECDVFCSFPCRWKCHGLLQQYSHEYDLHGCAHSECNTVLQHHVQWDTYGSLHGEQYLWIPNEELIKSTNPSILSDLFSVKYFTILNNKNWIFICWQINVILYYVSLWPQQWNPTFIRVSISLCHVYWSSSTSKVCSSK